MKLQHPFHSSVNESNTAPRAKLFLSFFDSESNTGTLTEEGMREATKGRVNSGNPTISFTTSKPEDGTKVTALIKAGTPSAPLVSYFDPTAFLLL